MSSARSMVLSVEAGRPRAPYARAPPAFHASTSIARHVEDQIVGRGPERRPGHDALVTDPWSGEIADTAREDRLQALQLIGGEAHRRVVRRVDRLELALV